MQRRPVMLKLLCWRRRNGRWRRWTTAWLTLDSAPEYRTRSRWPRRANRYLDTRAPWLAIKTDRADAACSLTAAIKAINCLKVMLSPYLPFSSQKLHEYLGFDGPVSSEPWDADVVQAAIQPGHALRNPAALYTKLDVEVAKQEAGLLGVSA